MILSALGLVSGITHSASHTSAPAPPPPADATLRGEDVAGMMARSCSRSAIIAVGSVLDELVVPVHYFAAHGGGCKW